MYLSWQINKKYMVKNSMTNYDNNFQINRFLWAKYSSSHSNAMLFPWRCLILRSTSISFLNIEIRTFKWKKRRLCLAWVKAFWKEQNHDPLSISDTFLCRRDSENEERVKNVLNSLFKGIICRWRWLKFLKWFLLERLQLTLSLKWEDSHRSRALNQYHVQFKWPQLTIQQETNEYVKSWFDFNFVSSRALFLCAVYKNNCQKCSLVYNWPPGRLALCLFDCKP